MDKATIPVCHQGETLAQNDARIRASSMMRPGVPRRFVR
jgi:hypothetical protein